jgi:hypothetical protein
MALSRKDYLILEEITRQKKLVKNGKQEKYDLKPFEDYIKNFSVIAGFCDAITTPPSEQEYNLATEIGKEVSRISGVDFIAFFDATGIKRRHISQKFNGYKNENFDPKIKSSGLYILLLDDIIQTGETLINSAIALKSLGNCVVPVAITYT